MRYLPHTETDIQEMLQKIGVEKISDLFASIPEALKLKKPLNLPAPISEMELRHVLREMSRKNAHGEDWAIFLGAGSYSHYIPSAVSQLLLRGEFLTAYTPYQPEVAQGTLQVIFEYQTMVCEILGMEVSNASHYDGSTATTEAALMALGITKRKKILIARSLHPEYRETLKTYIQDPEIEVVEIPFTSAGTLDRDFIKNNLNENVGCVVAAYPNFFGVVEDLSDVAELVHSKGALLVTSTTEAFALALFKSPGEMGADIAVAEGQSFGIPMAFGGPSVGFFATKEKYVRAIPGRLVGETVDADGKRGYVLTLATREQHIRREKASSNICTNVALCALAATITLTLLGKTGYQELAQINFDRAESFKEKLNSQKSFLKFSGNTFNEMVIVTKSDPEKLTERLLKEKMIVGIPLGRWYPELKDSLLLCLTEMNCDTHIQKLLEELQA